MKDLKERTIRGGVAKICAQGANLALRVGSLMVLARLLSPKDFGLVGMVTAFTGILSLFRDFGLSTAAVQRANVTDKQTSTLFWINVLVGMCLTVLLTAMGPFVARFYHEPRLVWICAAFHDRHDLPRREHFRRDRYGLGRMWLLVSRSNDFTFSCPFDYSSLGDDRVGARNTPQKYRNQVDAPIWRHHYSQWSGSLHCVQSREGLAG
jgi:hypothetical protein